LHWPYFGIALAVLTRCLIRGIFFTIQLLNEPLLVVRGDDNQVRISSTVCRHRRIPIAEGAGNAARFVCSYHAWTYGRDGELLRAACMKNAGFDRKSCKWRSGLARRLLDLLPVMVMRARSVIFSFGWLGKIRPAQPLFKGVALTSTS